VVWQLAVEHGCVLVTKDEGFHRLSVLRGAPPKVVWLRLGNCATTDIARLLRDRVDDILRFEAQAEVTFLELG
jgi:predicted nuclease of predicted toxin-antitoxin system